MSSTPESNVEGEAADGFGYTEDDLPPASWHTLSRSQLDAGLNNTAAVSHSGEIVAGWERRSAALRAKHPQHIDMRYGPRPRNRIDLLKVSDTAPTLLFIHGGYWQFRAKEDFTFAAAGPLACGINVALLGYTLAPEAGIDDIRAEVNAGIDFLCQELPRPADGKPRLVTAGWSAGGHLAAMALTHPQVAAALSISGVFDLEPIRRSYLNAKLGLAEGDVQRNSPLRGAAQTEKPVCLVVGSAELALLREQSARLAALRALRQLPTTYEEIVGANHFTIMDQMERPSGRVTTLVRRLLDDI